MASDMGICSVLSEPGRFAPLAADHPGVGTVCPGCDQALKIGDRPALVNGEPTSPEDQAKYDAGRAVTLAAVLAHEQCATEWKAKQDGE